MFAQGAANLDIVPSKVTFTSDTSDHGDKCTTKPKFATKPKMGMRFFSNLAEQQLVTTKCIMAASALTFTLCTMYFISRLILERSTDKREKPEFALSILLITIAFGDFVILGVCNKFIRQDVIDLVKG